MDSRQTLLAWAPSCAGTGWCLHKGGRPAGVQRLLDHMMANRDVWIARRVDIARHWVATHPYPGKGLAE